MDDELVSTLRLGNYSAAFILTSFAQSPYPPATIAYQAGIPVRVGQSREFGGRLLTHWIKPLPDRIHQAERNLHLLDELGISRQGTALELAIPLHIQKAADRLLHKVSVDPKKPFIVLVPGASCDSRQYDLGRFRQAAELFARDRVDLSVVILGSQKEAGASEFIGPYKDVGQRIVSLVGGTSVPEFAAVIRRARLVICNNSSALHFADAFRIPIVVLYSGTEDLEQWAPRESQAAILYRPVPCSPCYQFQCPYGKECLDIPPDEVVMRAQQLLWDQKISTGVHTGAVASLSSGR
jgi:ADP-heptose:LPS heptosyltransferase